MSPVRQGDTHATFMQRVETLLRVEVRTLTLTDYQEEAETWTYPRGLVHTNSARVERVQQQQQVMRGGMERGRSDTARSISPTEPYVEGQTQQEEGTRPRERSRSRNPKTPLPRQPMDWGDAVAARGTSPPHGAHQAESFRGHYSTDAPLISSYV